MRDRWVVWVILAMVVVVGQPQGLPVQAMAQPRGLGGQLRGGQPQGGQSQGGQPQGLPVQGEVSNGTEGGSVPDGLPVVLHVFTGMEEKGVYTTTVSADGTYSFSGLALTGDDFVMVSAVYQGVEYSSEIAPAIPAAPGQEAISLPLVIYETSSDPSPLEISQVHLFINGAGERVQVGEYQMVSNRGDRTYIGAVDAATGERLTVRVVLPEGAENLNFDGPGLGERFVEVEGGFADTEPVLPGSVTSEILFGYELPYRSGMRVERVFDLPVASVVFLVTEGQFGLEGEGIVPGERIDTRMGPALSYTAGPLDAGEQLIFTLTDSPGPAPNPAPLMESPHGAAPPAGRNRGLETGIGLASLAAAVLVVYWLLYRAPSPGPLPEYARPLVEEIAALDADFEGGRVAEQVYRKERDALKRRLRDLLVGGEGSE